MKNLIKIDFDKYKLGKIYYRNGKECIFDPIRKSLVILTKEEIVRQKFIQYLIKKIKIAKIDIQVEVAMSHFKKRAKGRADIIVTNLEEKEEGFKEKPTILVECKAKDVALTDDVWEQAFRYNEILKADLVMITNGISTYCTCWNENKKEYDYLEEIPEYKDILAKKNLKIFDDYSDDWERPKFTKLNSKKVIKNFFDAGWISESTDKKFYPLILNLIGFIEDTKVGFSPFEIDDFKIVEDGYRFTSFGNAAGGNWIGDYRYFILEDKYGNNQIVSISIIAGAKMKNDPVFGNRKGNTTLIVAIDDFDKKHNSLQLNIDNYTTINGKYYKIWHDGKLTVGNKGAAKKKDVMNFIKNNAPEIIDTDGNVMIGEFDCSKEIVWKQKESKQFIKNIIKYALIRDEYRRTKN